MAAIAVAAITAPAAQGALGDLEPQECIVDKQGIETCPLRSNGLDKPLDLALSPDGTSAYAASLIDDAVVRFIRDPATGELDPAGCIADVGGPGPCGRTTIGLDRAKAAAVSPDGRWLYVVSAPALVRFKRNLNSGAIKPVDCIGPAFCDVQAPGLTRGSAIDVSADGRSIYVTSATDDAITTFRRVGGGVLEPRECIQDAETTNPECDRFAAGLDGSRAVVISPDQQSVYVAGSDDFAIAHFRRIPNGRLKTVGCIADDDLGASPCAQTAPGLALPLGLAITPDGSSVYSTSHLDHAVALYSRDAGDGALTPGGCFEAPGGADTCTALTTGPLFATAIAVGPEGETVYVGTGEGDAILHLARAPGGALSFANCVEDVADEDVVECDGLSPGLNGPASITISDDGQHLYSTSRDDAVVHFARDAGP